uniref:Peroxin-7 n=1 Tax=Malawimonas jakobiformis TaxID=136089 RepID=A0A895KNN0_MALJA|nr:Gsp-co-occurring protein 2a [Malawimonas jakobiformis]
MLRTETEFVQSDVKFSHWDRHGLFGVTTEGHSAQYFGQLTGWRLNSLGTLDEVLSTPMRVGGTKVVESSEHESFLLTAHTDPVMRLWALSQPSEPAKRYLYHTMEVEDVQWSPFDGEEILSAGKDTTWALWSLAATDPVFVARHDSAMPYLAARFHPQNPALLVTAPLDGKLEMWHADDRERIYTLSPPEDVVFAAMTLNAYNENELVMATDAGQLLLWDLRAMQKPRAVHAAHAAPIAEIKFCPHDEHLLATTAADGYTHLWHCDIQAAEPLRLVRSFRPHLLPVTAMDWSVHELGLMCDASSDLSLLLWNIASND